MDESNTKLIELALHEDLGAPHHDITTALLFSEHDKIVTANISSKHSEPIVIAGLVLVREIIKQFDKTCTLSSEYLDSEILSPGKILLNLQGPATTLLMLERTLLNFLQRLCGIATLTAKYVAKISHTPTKILDTRKTTPGLRHLEKYAVSCGGGVNHRMGLYDAVMIKDTHIDFLGGIKMALAKLPDNIQQQYTVVVEVRTKEELALVLQEGLHKVSRVLLDNMSLSDLTDCVAACQGKIPTEASGNVTLETIAAIAECGVDFISIGKLTHSAKSIDLSMQCQL